jgi:FKBP-type peptidyl-prolyl cis-trans isomerase
MKIIREFSFYGIWVSFALIAFSCAKTNTDSIQIDDEKRMLKQYFIIHNITVQPLASGLYYLPTDTGAGIKPLSTDVVLYNFTLRLVNDKVIATNVDSVAKMNRLFNGGIFYRPFEYRVSWCVPGLQQGFELMAEGGKSTLIIPSILAFGQNGSSTYGVGPYYTLIYDVELLKVIHNPIEYEKTQIDQYIQDSISASLTWDKTDSGVYHFITKAGTGSLINDSSTVTMLYTLKLLDGTEVQEVSSTTSPFSYDLATASVVPGFKQAIKKMKNGEEAIIIIPYSQGYGEPSGNLPAFSTLVYYITILTVTNTYGSK